MSLQRFIDAQKWDYKVALKEIQQGKKTSHWIWYVFPQVKGLGQSYNSQYYGIKDLEEAKEYLENDILRERLLEISTAMLEQKDAFEVMGRIDAIKLKSSMTLFSVASEGKFDVFDKVLDKFFNGKKDRRTIKILERRANIGA